LISFIVDLNKKSHFESALTTDRFVIE